MDVQVATGFTHTCSTFGLWKIERERSYFFPFKNAQLLECGSGAKFHRMSKSNHVWCLFAQGYSYCVISGHPVFGEESLESSQNAHISWGGPQSSIVNILELETELVSQKTDADWLIPNRTCSSIAQEYSLLCGRNMVEGPMEKLKGAVGVIDWKECIRCWAEPFSILYCSLNCGMLEWPNKQTQRENAIQISMGTKDTSVSLWKMDRSINFWPRSLSL